MGFTTTFAALLLAGAPAVLARGRRGSSPTPTGPLEQTGEESTTTHTSRSTCTITGKTHTYSSSTPAEAYADLIVELTKYFCEGQTMCAWRPQIENDDWLPLCDSEYNKWEFEATTVARAIVDLHLDCETEGNAWACGSAWGDAEAFAAECIDLAVTAMAEIDTNSCACSSAIYADTSATAALFGHVLSSVYVSADLFTTCAGSGDPSDPAPEPIAGDSVEKQVVIDCTSKSIAKLTLQAVAKLFLNAECESLDPAVCDNCCQEEPGWEGCDCDDCTAEHKQVGELIVKAWTEADLDKERTCDAPTVEEYTQNYATFAGDQYSGFVRFLNKLDAPPTSSGCTLDFSAEVIATAVSAHVHAYETFIKEFCDGSVATPLNEDGELDIPNEVMAAASATVETFLFVKSNCFVTPGASDAGDADDNKACGYVEAFVLGFAEACASAIADVTASLTQTDCSCGGDLTLISNNFAEKQVEFFSALAQFASANACADTSNPQDMSEIEANCILKTYADLLAQATASAMSTDPANPIDCNDEDPTDKCLELCEAQIDAAYKPLYLDNCVSECSAEAWRMASLTATALAEIDLTVAVPDPLDPESGPATCGTTSYAGDAGSSVIIEESSKAPGATGGDIQATLRWWGPADLDIVLSGPAGATVVNDVSADPTTDCANAAYGPYFENSYVATVPSTTTGTYEVKASLVDTCFDGIVDYVLVLKVGGVLVESQVGSFNAEVGYTETGPAISTTLPYCCSGSPACNCDNAL